MEDKKTKKKSEKHIEELKKRIQELEDQLKRAVADYRNQETRFEDEKKEIVTFANTELLLKLLPAFDTLFLAERHVQDEGLKLTIKHLKDVLQDAGVDIIKTNESTFDPLVMECIDTAEGGEGKVIEEIRPGFTLFGKVIRPAQVKVGKNKHENKEEKEAKEEMLKGDYM